MSNDEKKNSIGQIAVLGVLWFINILIVIFGFPFLIYHKVRGIFVKTPKKFSTEDDSKTNSTRYLPCSIDSKL